MAVMGKRLLPPFGGSGGGTFVGEEKSQAQGFVCLCVCVFVCLCVMARVIENL